MDCTASASREEDLCNYARFLQGGYSYNVTLTATPQITIAARSSSELRRSEPAVVS
jgi:hypothetical protein